MQNLTYKVLNLKPHAVAAFFFLPSFAVKLRRNAQNSVTNSDLGALHCHSEFISESLPYRFRGKPDIFTKSKILEKAVKQVRNDGGKVRNDGRKVLYDSGRVQHD